MPEIHSRLSATLVLAMPGYEPAGTEGAITLVRPVAPAGQPRQVQVRAVSTPREGGWQTRLAVEPPEALHPPGTPADAIPGQLIELGSAAERQWRAAREAEAAAQHAAALAEAGRAAELQAAATRLAEARIAAAAAEEAATQREVAARHAATEARTRQIAGLRARLAGDSDGRLAALDLAMRSEDPAIRALGFEAALASRDAAATSLALRLTLLQKRVLPVQAFAPAVTGPGQTDAQEVAASVAGFALLLRDIDPATGQFAGTARLGGSEALLAGTLGRSELTAALRPLDKATPLLVGGVAQQACSLLLRLSEVQTLDGIFGCSAKQTPRLVVRVALD